MDRKTFVTIGVIIIIVLGVSSIYWFGKPGPAGENLNSSGQNNSLVLPAGNRSELKEEIIIDNLEDNDFIESPLAVSGQAKGEWFQEGEFAGRLVTEGGLILARTSALAETNWMTADFVSFTADFEFEPGEAESGYLLFTKSAPLGEPEENIELKIPVKLKN